MPEVVGKTLEEAERKLRELTWILDRTEYDDDEEYEESTKGIFPEQITAQAEHAAGFGSVVGLHSYARLLLREALKLKGSGQPYEELQARARDLARQAAKGGCWGAMDDLGRMHADEYGVEAIEMLAFMELAGGDMLDYVEHCRDMNAETYSQDEIDSALDIARRISQKMEAAGIEKKQCDCFDPLYL